MNEPYGTFMYTYRSFIDPRSCSFIQFGVTNLQVSYFLPHWRTFILDLFNKSQLGKNTLTCNFTTLTCKNEQSSGWSKNLVRKTPNKYQSNWVAFFDVINVLQKIHICISYRHHPTSNPKSNLVLSTWLVSGNLYFRQCFILSHVQIMSQQIGLFDPGLKSLTTPRWVWWWTR